MRGSAESVCLYKLDKPHSTALAVRKCQLSVFVAVRGGGLWQTGGSKGREVRLHLDAKGHPVTDGNNCACKSIVAADRVIE